VADVGQFNTGDVIVSSSLKGASYGGDGVVASTAIGNAFTGFVCSYCGDAAASGEISQKNTGTIVSTGTIIAKGADTLFGSASAIGNTATFITTTRKD
jgi:hypothetical protein